ncbi:BT_3987 domain-containing protein [Arachidicoccus terrestris]|uniref:BT_3987 domain-containing protein n=1 Tax=Arachidicoccus terrestris TaxID=2875539 RepID=UPI001CC3A2B0|nr:DUF1735 domain-containing protein [Arachidicoccus terrestris]UAY53854.1 DUF1735 domain-containing protein [Arachidicoccus terrestris]
MKKSNNKYNITLTLAALLMAFAITGCNKWDELTSPNEGNVYMPQAYAERAKLHLYRIDSSQTFVFGASLGGFNGATQDMAVEFEVDPNLISQYNQDHVYLNYNFIALPEDAYSISSLNSTIKKGKSDSDPVTVTIMTNKLNPNLDYCLPVKIKSTSLDSKIDSVLQVSYFLIDSFYIRYHDIPGILTVAKDNNDGPTGKEGSTKLTDNDYGTKFLYEFEKNTWMQLKLDKAVKLNAYEITSANDADTRDPKDWEFQGSNDGINWFVLDEQSGNIFPNRNTTYRYELNRPDGKEYLYYRLFVKDNNGSSLLQIAEWRLLEYY